MGSGSAGQGTALILILLCFLLRAESAKFTVGDGSGWSFGASSWPQGKRFMAGDVLVFNYDPSVHNVVAVSSAGYSGCTTPAGAKVYSSGSDEITLVKGTNYFVCNFAGHCESGMKIAVTAV
ncbi:basic blue protein-like [Typha angustifolia]|uniref:basic blue protein-like n=1 Tax=Typha angustifolia TaxID=59011 RepID=UPI003C303427